MAKSQPQSVQRFASVFTLIPCFMQIQILEDFNIWSSYVLFTVSDCDCDCENCCDKMGTEPIVSQQFFCSRSDFSKKSHRRNQKITDKVKYLCLRFCFRSRHAEEDFGSTEEFWC